MGWLVGDELEDNNFYISDLCSGFKANEAEALSSLFYVGKAGSLEWTWQVLNAAQYIWCREDAKSPE